MGTIKVMDTPKVVLDTRDTDKVRIGVIGCGYWGPNLIRNFRDNPNSSVVAVADLRPEKLEYIRSNFPDVEAISDYRQLFTMGLDAVVVATPPGTHYTIAKELLEHGLNVMVEKPLTLKSEHAQELVDIAAQKDLILMVGHTFEFNSAVQTLKEMIQKGDLGDIRTIDSARLNLGLYQKETNVLWDLAPHDISILCYILGKDPISVIAQGATCVNENVCDVAYINLKFPNNILAHVHVSWLDPYKVRRVTVVGSKKMVVFNDVENEKIKIIDKGVTSITHSETFTEYQYSYRNGDILIPYVRFVEPLRQETMHFIECVKNHQTPITDGKDGLRVVKILEAAQRSLMNNSSEEVI